MVTTIVDGTGHGGRRVRRLSPGGDELVDRASAPAVDGQAESAREEMASHGLSHHAETDEPNALVHEYLRGV